MLPDFIIAGTPRAGSTTLSAYCVRHPGIGITYPTELHFFDRDCNYNQGMGHYSCFFEHCVKGGDTAEKVGETTPSYIFRNIKSDQDMFRMQRNQVMTTEEQECAPVRIWHHLPDVKIIMSLRDPVERTYSEYLADYVKKRYKKQFSDVIKKHLRDPDNSILLSKSLYSFHLKKWFELFPPEQIKVIVLEEWKKQPDIIKDMFRFIGVDPDVEIEPQKWNDYKTVCRNYGSRRVVKPSMDRRTRRLLYEFYKPEIERTEKLLDRDLSVWKAKKP